MFAGHRQARTFLPPENHCPLCPTRPGHPPTEIAQPAFDVVVFENRFPSLVADPPTPDVAPSPLYDVAPSRGANEMVVYSDDHHLEVSAMDLAKVVRIVEVWSDRYAALGGRDDVDYVLIFENRGEAMGVTLHHPHGQIYAYPEVPPRPLLELTTATTYRDEVGTCVFCDVVAHERADNERVVVANDDFVAFVPFAARYPYEIHVVAVRHTPSLLEVTQQERESLAALLKGVFGAYDGLFGFPLPYVMAIHQAPTDDGRWLAVSHLHLEFMPPHRTATKLKLIAGSELGGGAFINATSPEATAARLRRAIPPVRDRPPEVPDP